MTVTEAREWDDGQPWPDGFARWWICQKCRRAYASPTTGKPPAHCVCFDEHVVLVTESARASDARLTQPEGSQAIGSASKTFPTFSVRDEAAPTREETREIREWLWINHGCPISSLYGDDGELQCGNGRPHHLPLDFRRQPLLELLQAVVAAGDSHAASQLTALQQEKDSIEEQAQVAYRLFTAELMALQQARDAIVRKIAVLSMTAASDPHAEVSVYRTALADICTFALSTLPTGKG